MPQNLVSTNFSEQGLVEKVDAALLTLEKFTESAMIGLTPEERRRLTKMGEKSESFCRLTSEVVRNSAALMPGGFNFAEYVSDLEQLDLLRPRFVRLSKIMQLWSDTNMALGSDLMVNSLEAYALLKIIGKSTGLDELRKQMSLRFQRGPRQIEPEPRGQ